MQNGGQTCISVERVYVEAPVYDAFVDRLTPRQRDDLVRLAPTTIGNLDGIPLTMRYAANESVLAEAPTPTVEQVLAVQPASASGGSTAAGGGGSASPGDGGSASGGSGGGEEQRTRPGRTR